MREADLDMLPWHAEAHRALGEQLFGYLVGRAHDTGGAERDGNHARLAGYRLLPRVLATPTAPNPKIQLFGHTFGAPLAVGAFAGDRLFHPSGLLPVAVACRQLALPLIVSEETVTPLAEICVVTPDVWLQLRAAGDPRRIERLIGAAAAAGAAGIVLTVLAPVNPRPGLEPGAFSVGAEIAARGWTTIGSEAPGIAALPAVPGWSWQQVAAMVDGARAHGLPVLVKGVLRDDDAKRAAEAGCGGIIVSNIGLRQSGRWAAPADRLPGLRRQFGGALLLDGGVRSGTDILVACCLGADLAVVVRPVIAALAARGEAGVVEYLSRLIAAFEALMFWCGAADPAGLDAALLEPGESGPPS